MFCYVYAKLMLALWKLFCATFTIIYGYILVQIRSAINLSCVRKNVETILALMSKLILATFKLFFADQVCYFLAKFMQSFANIYL